MGIEKYLNKIQENVVIKKNDRLRCKVCGRVVTVKKAGTGPLICCGEPMTVTGTVLEAGFSNLPKGWTQSSVKKFAKNLVDKGGGKSEGFFDKCVEKMKDKIDNPEGFCAGVKDEIYSSTGWRGKGKTPEEVRKDVKKKEFKIK